MIHKRISSTTELTKFVAQFGDDALFRGQVRHYGGLHAPAMNTSFSRQGCIPHQMLKWAHYACFSLVALLGKRFSDADFELSQAVLQHYGWRSFYLDASCDAGAAAWFAGNAFNSKRAVDMREDCFEEGVMLIRQFASYGPSDDEGHFYVLSKAALKAIELKAVDLSALSIPNCRPRFQAQSAWLVGPLHGNLDLSCILVHVTAPAAVFREFASANGMNSTADLFPRASDDPVLDTLLSLPWVQQEESIQPAQDRLAFFRRSIELPEYFNEYRKILPVHLAFYHHTKLADDWEGKEGLHFVQIPDWALFGSPDLRHPTLPHVTNLTRTHSKIVFEADALLRLPELGHSSEYGKGVFVERLDDGILAVSDLVVSHPGLQVHGFGMDAAWHYKADKTGRWTRVAHPADCPCDKQWRHQHHLAMLIMIEENLAKSSVTPQPVAR